jgi:hypothetical protein
MSDERLTTELAVRAMRWRLAPGRYLKPERGWSSRSGCRPLGDLNVAFQVLDALTDDYSVLVRPGDRFTVRVRTANRTRQAMGKSQARTISLAVAQALEINWEENG